MPTADPLAYADGMNLQQSLESVLADTEHRVAGRFYEEFFARHPEVQPYFSETNIAHQQTVLTMALQIIVQHQEQDYPSTASYLKVLGHKHYERKIPRDDYPKFTECLLASLAEFHAADWSGALAESWRGAIDKSIATMLEGYVEGPLFY